MGQHGIVGEPSSISSEDFPGPKFGYNESVQVPMLVSLPDSVGDFQAIRSGKMTCPTTIPSLVESFLLGDDCRVAEWVQHNASLPTPETSATLFDFENESGIQTHAWKFLQTSNLDHCELYAKPDDRWEVNDVSQRCPNEVRLLRELLGVALNNPQSIANPQFKIPHELVTRHH